VYAEGELDANAEKTPYRKINAIRITIQNDTETAWRVVWGDFFARVNRGKWVGSWWKAEEPYPDKIKKKFTPDLDHCSEVKPEESISYVLVDPWISPDDLVEYKFICLMVNPDGAVFLSESPAVEAVPIEVEKSGVELALTGIAAALKSLFSSSSSAPLSPSPEIGVSVSHKPLGAVEIAKYPRLLEEIQSWKTENASLSDPPLFYVYQTEVVNNTISPVRLLQLVVSTQHEGKWLSGVFGRSIISEEELVGIGFLQKTDEDGVPHLSKMEDSWIPPGARVVLPYQWHPKISKPTSAKYLAVMIDSSGRPVMSESIVGKEESPVHLPTSSTKPSFSEDAPP